MTDYIEAQDERISGGFVPGGLDKMNYGSVPMSPFIFQDDVIHGAGGIKEARIANNKIYRIVKSLNLSLNQEKTVCLVMGRHKQSERETRGRGSAPYVWRV